jgi:threonine aldolase
VPTNPKNIWRWNAPGGYLAAAGIYALNNNIERLAEDHRRAKELRAVLSSKSWAAKVEPVETNILIYLSTIL